jgi:hypothetical protein
MQYERIWSFNAIVVCCMAIIASILCASDKDLEYLFNSDALYLPSIYHDVAFGAGLPGLKEWFFNPAPNFFPDMGAFLALNAMLGDLRLATYVFALLQVAVILLLVRRIARLSGLVQSDTGFALGTLLMGLLAMMGHWAGDFNLTFQLLINSYHTGAFLNALLSTLLMIHWLNGSAGSRLAVLCLVVLLGAASDKLYWVLFVVPATLACIVLAIRSKVRWRLLLTAVLLVAFTWLGHRGLHLLDESFPLDIAKPYAYQDFGRVTRSWHQFVEVNRWYLNGPTLMIWCTYVPLLVTIAAFVKGTRMVFGQLFGPMKESQDVSHSLTALMSCLFFPMALLAPILNGSFDGGDSIRYNFAVYMLAPLVLGIFLGNHAPKASRILTLVGIGLLGVPMLWYCATRDHQRVLTFKPEKVIALDELAREMDLRNGVANYWDAKVITLFTERSLNVLPVFSNMAMYVKVNREKMFLRGKDGEAMVFDFVVKHDELQPEGVSSSLSFPCELITRPAISIIRTRPWFYDPKTRLPAPSQGWEAVSPS